MGTRIILTGATGMVGEGVLLECLQHPEVEKVLIINRKPAGLSHPKLEEILHSNFFDLSPVAQQLQGYDGCLFCLGVSSIGMKENEYRHLTYDLTMHVATVLSQQNKAMTFCYISGANTDSTEKGRSMWARVKGKTENDLAKLPFKKVFNFRPGLLKPTKGQKNTLRFYKYVGWLYPVIRNLFPNAACTIKELGLAMINAVTKGYEKQILEVKDIVALSKDQRL
ncbi:MAG TPA: epimerase [Chitinophagaceae bacterium]